MTDPQRADHVSAHLSVSLSVPDLRPWRTAIVAGLDIGSTKTCAVVLGVSPDAAEQGLRVLGVGQARTAVLETFLQYRLAHLDELARRAHWSGIAAMGGEEYALL